MALSPCPGCQRHVRRHERACPFCAHALPLRVAATPLPAARVSRALLMGGALALVGCGSGTPRPDPPDDDVVHPGDDGGDDADSGDEDPGNLVAEYGAPAPPPEDEDDPGAMVPKYGAPPPPP